MNGIILVDKEQDFTSFDVVAIMKGICNTGKVGHMGTLDPMATGVLPVMIGSATKIQKFLKSDRKAYRASFRFGIATDTEDIWGNVTEKVDCDIDYDKLPEILSRFVGKIEQVPPMYSAVKVNGVRLYKLARKGEVVERKSRTVMIYSIDYLGVDDNGDCVVDIECSEGTYIRTLLTDIGRAMNVPATMTGLVRTRSNGFSVDDCVKISELKKLKEEGRLSDRLITPEKIFADYEDISVGEAQAFRFKNGGGLSFDRLKKAIAPNEFYRVYHGNDFLGLGFADENKSELRVCFHNN